ncbi:MAG TPA: hypothetical protein VF765_36805 [Polyangiaceae bacterium]
MRLRSAIALSIVSAGFGAGLVACFDLFHSTSNILDACELDAEACGDAGAIDFCEASTPPYASAALACTWIDRCEGTFEHNDFGECMVRALLAYDCTSNPNNPVSGPTKQMWIDLLRASSCDDVDRIVFAGSVPTCQKPGSGCSGATRAYCPEAGARAHGENCAMWNEICDTNLGCIGCLGCFAGADAGACTPDASATCNGDIATSCPAGALEAIDCNELLQQTGTCNPGPLTGQDPTSACFVDAGDAGAACTEGCMGNVVTACARGATFNFDCSSIDAGCQQDAATATCTFSQ